MGERDFAALIDGVNQLVKAPIVLVWDRLNTHVSRKMRDFVDEREWLTVAPPAGHGSRGSRSVASHPTSGHDATSGLRSTIEQM
ncbi:hypothetical protein [Streptomyces sp. NPDC056661]|uniref:hypothetical protein n=1 Tax=Streptomyces sp. NPDC056661 TaxID=3345898 RepID=UPI0036B8D058